MFVSSRDRLTGLSVRLVVLLELNVGDSGLDEDDKLVAVVLEGVVVGFTFSSSSVSLSDSSLVVSSSLLDPGSLALEAAVVAAAAADPVGLDWWFGKNRL